MKLFSGKSSATSALSVIGLRVMCPPGRAGAALVPCHPAGAWTSRARAGGGCRRGASARRTAASPARPLSLRADLRPWEGSGMSETGGDLDLRSLDDEELTKQIGDDLYDGLKDEVVEGVHILLERGWTPYRVLTEALVAGLRVLGIVFRDGILFVPEVLLATNAMKAGMTVLRPLLVETGAPPSGKMVIGTVKGDIHDIGKNLVAMMMEGAGFEVIDLGINCDVDKYLAALEQHQPDILGMSALLTTTMPYMKVVIDTLGEKELRDRYIVLCGGAPLNEEFGRAIGADAYCRDAAVAAETAKELVAAQRSLRVAEPPGPSVRG